MTSFAEYAPSQAEGRRGPSPWMAALLTLLTPGLGHVYIGQARRGITLFTLVMVADTLLMFSLMGVLARFWMFAVSLTLLLALWLFIVIDAARRAQQMRETPRYGYNRWPIYAGACVLAWVVTAVPILYAVHANASGSLGVFRATSSSMEPTVKAGEYFLADATYYRGHHPSRGDVVVYQHPQHAGMHVVRRVVAIEGDRVAVKAGRAVVNGMAVVEPYVEEGDPHAALNNMAEIRVPPGYVFVLGDNRASSSDSRDAAHGPVPLANLNGRVTDVALSRVVGRMGRWVGTPSKP